ncbi:MAG: 6-phosphogluconolactonase [Calditrichia bacterium]
MRIQVYSDREEMSRAAADFFVQTAKEAVEAHGRFIVALSGGSTPKETYRILAQAPFKQQVPWEKTYIFWGDERCVPWDDPRSNAHMTYDTLLKYVTVPSKHIFRMQCALSPKEAASQYEAVLHQLFDGDQPRFDLIFLGLGENGHTASLFPNSEVLTEKSRLVSEVYLPELEMYRITFTAYLINQAANVAFLVSGKKKSEILPKVIEGPRKPEELPAQLIEPLEGEIYWFIDQAAASGLKEVEK